MNLFVLFVGAPDDPIHALQNQQGDPNGYEGTPNT